MDLNENYSMIMKSIIEEIFCKKNSKDDNIMTEKTRKLLDKYEEITNENHVLLIKIEELDAEKDMLQENLNENLNELEKKYEEIRDFHQDKQQLMENIGDFSNDDYEYALKQREEEIKKLNEEIHEIKLEHQIFKTVIQVQLPF